MLLLHPVEWFDRLRDRVELFQFQHRLFGATSVPYGDEPHWERHLHSLLDAPWPCPQASEAQVIWSELVQLFGNENLVRLGRGHDADLALAQAMWCIVLHLQPSRVLETGVARGITSRFILEGLERNGAGHLWSIDLPPMQEGWRHQSGSAVPEHLRDRWTYIRGSSRRLLPPLLAKLGGIDLFIHDSLHTQATVEFELKQALPVLRSGGLAVVDDIGKNRAFASLSSTYPENCSLVAKHEAKHGAFGLLLKP